MLLKNISQISLQRWGLWEGAERQTKTAQGAVLSLQRSVANAILLPQHALGAATFSGSALRVSHRRSPQRSKERRSVCATGAPA